MARVHIKHGAYYIAGLAPTQCGFSDVPFGLTERDRPRCNVSMTQLPLRGSVVRVGYRISSRYTNVFSEIPAVNCHVRRVAVKCKTVSSAHLKMIS
jgi:hypothetical protein